MSQNRPADRGPTRRPVQGRCPGCADVPVCGRPVPLAADGTPTQCVRCAPVARPTARHWTDRPAHRGAEPPKLPGSPSFRRDTAGLAARLFGEEGA